MVKIALQVKMTLDNIEEVRPADDDDFRWYLKFVCNNCGEKWNNWCYVCLSDIKPGPKGHSVNHFVSKCKLCSRENSMTILKESIQSYKADDQDRFKTIVVFDCRGLEPCDFSPRNGWVAKAIDDGKEFTDVDLTEGEWADYCEKIKKQVGIYEIEHQFKRIK